ncbi:MAG: HD domain-containing protein [Clostridia bacterium]|nr:HD domain-containing protein [Clostridia bacterium]
MEKLQYFFDTKNKVVVRKYIKEDELFIEHFIDGEWKFEDKLFTFFVAAYFGYTDDYDVDDETLQHITEEQVEEYIHQQHLKKQLQKAIDLAKKYHEGQVDKAGKPYFLHPQTVASLVDDLDAKIVAYMHDLIEDTPVTKEFLLDCGFDEYIVDAVDMLTHKDKNDYFDYVRGVAKNPLAKKVKIADLTTNSDLSRLDNPTKTDFERAEKYKKALQILQEKN